MSFRRQRRQTQGVEGVHFVCGAQCQTGFCGGGFQPLGRYSPCNAPTSCQWFVGKLFLPNVVEGAHYKFDLVYQNGDVIPSPTPWRLKWNARP